MSNSEGQNLDGYCLVSIDDHLKWFEGADTEFETPQKLIPDIGWAYIHGYNDPDDCTDDNLGIAVIDGAIRVDNTPDFIAQGLFK